MINELCLIRNTQEVLGCRSTMCYVTPPPPILYIYIAEQNSLRLLYHSISTIITTITKNILPTWQRDKLTVQLIRLTRSLK